MGEHCSPGHIKLISERPMKNRRPHRRPRTRYLPQDSTFQLPVSNMILSYLINVHTLVFLFAFLCELSEELSICILHQLAFILFIRDRYRFRLQGERRGRWDRGVGTRGLYRCPTCALAMHRFAFNYGISTAARLHSGKRTTREPEPVAQRVLRP